MDHTVYKPYEVSADADADVCKIPSVFSESVWKDWRKTSFENQASIWCACEKAVVNYVLVSPEYLNEDIIKIAIVKYRHSSII